MESYSACNVCQKHLCGHVLPEVAIQAYENELKASAQTPLDRGVARFAAEVAYLMSPMRG